MDNYVLEMVNCVDELFQEYCSDYPFRVVLSDSLDKLRILTQVLHGNKLALEDCHKIIEEFRKRLNMSQTDMDGAWRNLMREGTE